MRVGDRASGVRAVAAPRSQAVKVQLIGVAHPTGRLPELAQGVVAKIEQVGDVRAGNEQQVQPGATVRVGVWSDHPVLEPPPHIAGGVVKRGRAEYARSL